MTWTNEAINQVRQRIVDEIREKLEEKGAVFHTLAHNISNGALKIRLTSSDLSDEVVDHLTNLFETVVTEIVHANPAHDLATLPVKVMVQTPT